MIPRYLKTALVAVGMTALTLVGASTASAAITATNVTSPSDQSFFLYNDDLGSDNLANRIKVTGTAVGAAPGDTVRVRCYYSQTSSNTVKSNVPVAEDGTWTAIGTLDSISDETCILRAIPTGGTFDSAIEADRAAFTGPEVHTHYFSTDTSSSQVYDFYLGVNGKDGYQEFDSLTDYSLYYQYLRDRTNPWVAFGSYIHDGSNSTWANSTFTPAFPAAATARPYMTVDGFPAWTAYDGDPDFIGFQEMTVDVSMDAAGNVTLHETEPLFRCLPDELSCTKYGSLGVTFDRTIVASNTGLVSSFTDKFVNTSGASHTVDFQMVDTFDGNSPAVQYRLNGASAWTPSVTGETVAMPAGSNSIVVTDTTTADDANAANKPFAFVAWNTAPSSAAYFQTPTVLHRPLATTLAAGATYETKSTYGTAQTLAAATTQAAAAKDRLDAPKVAITAPTAGLVIALSPTTVTGTTSDNVGVTSVTVNGVAATLGAGTWSASVPLTAGANTLKAVAKDASGNEASASVAVTFTPVPPGPQKVFVGTEGKDTLKGNEADNEISGLGGDDKIDCGVGGKDTANGGAGNDTINCVESYATGKANKDTIDCGTGTKDVAIVDPFDTVKNCEKVTRVWNGGSKADKWVAVKARNDQFNTLGGNDNVTCSGGVDTAKLGLGNDTINCWDAGKAAAKKKSKDVIDCGAGTNDVAIVDKYDVVKNCEKVTRKA